MHSFLANVKNLGRKILPLWIPSTSADACNHGGNEEQAGGCGPEASGEEDLEVAISAHQVGEENITNDEWHQTDQQKEAMTLPIHRLLSEN